MNISDINEISKTLFIQDKTYCWREAVSYFGADCWGLKVKSGHYIAYIYKSNDFWELYDDLRDCLSVSEITKKKYWSIIIPAQNRYKKKWYFFSFHT